MGKTLTTVGNSKAVILPALLVKKYKLLEYVLEDTGEGILIRPVGPKTSLEEKLAEVRERRSEVYAKMERAANTPEAIAYYENQENTFDDVDPEVQ